MAKGRFGIRGTLPMIGHGGGRSAMTCAYRCGNACAHEAPNKSDNPYFGDVLEAALSRRDLLKAGAAAAVVLDHLRDWAGGGRSGGRQAGA